MPMICQFYLFVQIVGLASQNPVTDQSSKHRPALVKCGVKGSTAGEGSQAGDLHTAYQDKRLTKSLPR